MVAFVLLLPQSVSVSAAFRLCGEALDEQTETSEAMHYGYSLKPTFENQDSPCETQTSTVGTKLQYQSIQMELYLEVNSDYVSMPLFNYNADKC